MRQEEKIGEERKEMEGRQEGSRGKTNRRSEEKVKVGEEG